MPATKLQERARKKYVTVKDFYEQFKMSKTQAYAMLQRPEFDEVKIKVGAKAIRIDLDKAFEIMTQIYR